MKDSARILYLNAHKGIKLKTTLFFGAFVALLLSPVISHAQSNVDSSEWMTQQRQWKRWDQQNVYHSLFQTLAAQKYTEGDTVRLYIDRQGDIYPPPGYLPDASFANRNYGQALFNWFHAAKHRSQLTQLSLYCGVPASDRTNTFQHWERIQDTLAAQTARYINKQSRTGGKQRTLVTLIHGYNNSPDANTFYSAEHALRNRLQNAVWLEVRWDGLHKNFPVGIWAAGQLNARFAGIALREVLYRTTPTMPIRIFTHSAGAIVGSHALWNASPLRQPEVPSRRHSDTDIVTLMNNTPTPINSDIRMGMMAPATTPLIFRAYNTRTCGTAQNPQPCAPNAQQPSYRVVVGQNARDFAVTKSGVTPAFFGDTELGCRIRAFDTARTNCDCPIIRVEFSTASGDNPSLPQFRYNDKLLLESHAWGLYWLRPKAQEFVKAVLD